MPGFLPADFRASVHLIKTEHYKIATFFSILSCGSKAELASKKIFDKDGSIAQNNPKIIFYEMVTLKNLKADYNLVII